MQEFADKLAERKKRMITVAQFHLIKHCIEREGLSQRETAQKLGISRNTVKKHLNQEQPLTSKDRKQTYGGRKPRSETERILPLIDEWLKADQSVWKKQRHTAARIYQRLVDEYDFRGCESNIRRLVPAKRPDSGSFYSARVSTRPAISFGEGSNTVKMSLDLPPSYCRSCNNWISRNRKHN
jgi:transposase